MKSTTDMTTAAISKIVKIHEGGECGVVGSYSRRALAYVIVGLPSLALTSLCAFTRKCVSCFRVCRCSVCMFCSLAFKYDSQCARQRLHGRVCASEKRKTNMFCFSASVGVSG